MQVISSLGVRKKELVEVLISGGIDHVKLLYYQIFRILYICQHWSINLFHLIIFYFMFYSTGCRGDRLQSIIFG